MDIETLNLATDKILSLNEDNINNKCSGYGAGINDAIRVINYMIHDEHELQTQKSRKEGE